MTEKGDALTSAMPSEEHIYKKKSRVANVFEQVNPSLVGAAFGRE